MVVAQRPGRIGSYGSMFQQGRARSTRVEALVAQREVGNLLVAQRQRQPDQLWNDGSTTL